MQRIENMPRPEIILVADTVAREKNIDKEDVFEAMEIAIQKAARSKYGFEHDIRATIDRKTGAISLARYREVVDEIVPAEGEEDDSQNATKILLEDALAYDENAESIPESVRKAGFGGTNRYEHLMSLSNPELVVSTTQKMDMLRKQLYIQSNSLEELISLGKNQEERSKCIPAIQPISNKDLRRTASGYGVRIDPIYRTPRFHSGMDFSAKVGTEIYATGNGVVTFAAWKQGYGNCLIIDHGYGYQTLYGHMSKFKKRVGQKVTRGEVIGEVGNTGKSTGPHLHYEVIVRGKYDNPSKYYYMDLSPEEYDRMIQIAENHGQVMD